MMANTGLDPELLATQGSNAWPAEFFVPAPSRDKHGTLNALSYDNAATEFRPTHSAQVARVTARLRLLLRDATCRLKSAMLRRAVPLGTRFSLIPCAPLQEPHRALRSVMSFGCSPSQGLMDDFSVQTTVPFITAKDTGLRSAGFHVHQELAADSSVQAGVAVLDALLGLCDVLVNAELGYTIPARQRRMTLGYGRAGEHRVRKIGHATVLEYRTLSPWPMASPAAVSAVSLLTRAVFMQPERVLLNALADFPDRAMIARTINECDPLAAAELHAACSNIWNRHMEEINAKHAAQQRSLLATVRAVPGTHGLKPALGNGGGSGPVRDVGRAAAAPDRFLKSWRF